MLKKINIFIVCMSIVIIIFSLSLYESVSNDRKWNKTLDMDNNDEWNKIFRGRKMDSGKCVIQTSDGGYIIAGYTESYGTGDFDAWLVKLPAASSGAS